MRKIPVLCSLLMAFSLSAMIVGCEPKKPAVSPPTKLATPSSTTGKGTDVPPKSSKGSVEKPKAVDPAAEKPEAPKEEDAPKKDDAPKDGDTPKAPETPKDGDEAPKN